MQEEKVPMKSLKLWGIVAVLGIMLQFPGAAFAASEDSAKSARPVETRLKQMTEESSKLGTPEFAEASEQALQDLIKSRITETALSVGDTMPSFELPDPRKAVVKSKDLLAAGPIVIVFYRGAWCPYCNFYLRSMQEYLPEIKAHGATLVAISGENPDNSLSVEQKDSLTYPVLSDTGLSVARKFGIVYKVAPVIDKAMRDYGIDFRTYYNSDKAELPLGATYVVDKTGKIVYAYLDADYRHRAEPADVLAALKEHGRKPQEKP
jgi:peroxiredoxin